MRKQARIADREEHLHRKSEEIKAGLGAESARPAKPAPMDAERAVEELGRRARRGGEVGRSAAKLQIAALRRRIKEARRLMRLTSSPRQERRDMQKLVRCPLDMLVCFVAEVVVRLSPAVIAQYRVDWESAKSDAGRRAVVEGMTTGPSVAVSDPEFESLVRKVRGEFWALSGERGRRDAGFLDAVSCHEVACEEASEIHDAGATAGVAAAAAGLSPRLVRDESNRRLKGKRSHSAAPSNEHGKNRQLASSRLNHRRRPKKMASANRGHYPPKKQD